MSTNIKKQVNKIGYDVENRSGEPKHMSILHLLGSFSNVFGVSGAQVRSDANRRDIVFWIFPRFFKLSFINFLGLLLGSMVPDRFRKLREKISLKLVPTWPHITFRGPRYEGETIWNMILAPSKDPN